MSNILSQISGIILAGINVEDQQMFDGIRNLANMSLISYPKARFLQIILDPRMISQDGNVLIKCANFKFGCIREQLIEDLGKKLLKKEMIMMLKSFVNQLLDNNQVIHIHLDGEPCQENTLHHQLQAKLLYNKCQELGLQYGFLNLFPGKILLKISKSKYKIVDQIIDKVNDPDEFKEILHLFSVDYQAGLDITKIVSHISSDINGIFRYIISLPKPLIEILLDYITLTSGKISYERIEDLVELYNKRRDLFLSVKKKPLLAKLFMIHDNFQVMNGFLDIIAHNNEKIAEIHSFNSSLSSFLFSHISSSSQKNDAKALMKLGMTDIIRSKQIIANAPIIDELGLKICLLCNLVKEFPAVFDVIFDKKSENLDIIYHLKKNRKISADSVIKEIISLKSLDEVKDFFCKMHEEYDQ